MINRLTRLNSSASFYHLLDQISNFLWAVALVSLPITSFTPFVRLTGGLASPFAIIPVFLLLLIWFLPYILKRGSLPKESLLLVGFLVTALVASLLAFFLNIPSFGGKNILGQELRAFMTLAIGMGFYFIFASFPIDENRLRNTLKWLDIGGIILILWTLFQVYLIFHSTWNYPGWFVSLQNRIVEKAPLIKTYGDRVSGLAYEPSWFAHQMVILYIPIWLAASYTKQSAFKSRLFFLSLENILLGFSVVEFFLCSPRISLVAFLFILLFIFMKFNVAIYEKVLQIIAQGKVIALSYRFIRISIALALAILFITAYILAFKGSFYLTSQHDGRIAALVKNPIKWDEIKSAISLDENTWIGIGLRFSFFERVLYWVTGFHTFNDHLWFGVGLGNSGFFFQQNMPSVGYGSDEIRLVLYELTSLPNIKNLWVRLLAETGFVGFSIFIGWLVILWRSAASVMQSKRAGLQLFALAGQLSLLALIAEGFSVDSFSLPYWWIMTGLISAVGLISRKEMNEKKEPQVFPTTP